MEQKRILLKRLEEQNKVSILKKTKCEELIGTAKIELGEIEKLTAQSEELQAQEQQREEQVKGQLLLEIGASPKCQCQQYLSEHQEQEAELTK